MSEVILSLNNIHKRFGDIDVLKGITLHARSGDVISILGSSGSGKSTLLRCINFLETPNAGSINVAGHEVICDDDTGQHAKINQQSIYSMRAQLGMVFQGFNLWSHMTVLENVMEAPVYVLKQAKAEVKIKALAYLAKVGLGDKADQYPAQLSGGQKQRVAIARALAMEPKILLFDEPTSALDPELVNEVLLVMQALAAEGRTMLVVTHEMGFARTVSNRVIFLHEGLIEEDAAPDDFFENPKSLRVRDFISHQK
ncbi:MAG: octopine/nopaline transport system ATP-binding protein [Pseudohongiellaceae bacterium]|jgi:octopine/nopaline transport system ATP-binding protein